ncbi:hypothetical protein Tco_0581057 [Tanacetum coccineum]
MGCGVPVCGVCEVGGCGKGDGEGGSPGRHVVGWDVLCVLGGVGSMGEEGIEGGECRVWGLSGVYVCVDKSLCVVVGCAVRWSVPVFLFWCDLAAVGCVGGEGAGVWGEGGELERKVDLEKDGVCVIGDGRWMAEICPPVYACACLDGMMRGYRRTRTW